MGFSYFTTIILGWVFWGGFPNASQVNPRGHGPRPHWPILVGFFGRGFPMEISSNHITGWWLDQPLWTIWVKMGIFPNFRGEHEKYLKPPSQYIIRIKIGVLVSWSLICSVFFDMFPKIRQNWHLRDRGWPFDEGLVVGDDKHIYMIKINYIYII